MSAVHGFMATICHKLMRAGPHDMLPPSRLASIGASNGTHLLSVGHLATPLTRHHESTAAAVPVLASPLGCPCDGCDAQPFVHDVREGGHTSQY
jgi:hypothetical protein